MNQSNVSPNDPRPVRWFAFIVLGILVVVFWKGFFEHILLGWFYFLRRTIPKFTVDWPTAVIGGISLLLLTIGFHFASRWFYEASNGSPADLSIPKRVWRFRTSVILLAIALLMFVSGTSLVGAAHQVVWIMTGRVDKAAEIELQASRQERIKRIFEKKPFKFVSGRINEWEDASNVGQIRYRFSLTMYPPPLEDDPWDSPQAIEARNNRRLPPGGTMTEDGTLLHGWGIYCEPFENLAVSDFDMSVPWHKPPNSPLYKKQFRTFINPAISERYFDDRGYGLCHFRANVNVMSIVKIPKTRTEQERKGLFHTTKYSGQKVVELGPSLSTTIQIGTVGTGFKPWGDPTNVCDPAIGINQPGGLGGPSAWNGAYVVLCDGTVRYLNEKIDRQVLQKMSSPYPLESSSQSQNVLRQ